MSTKNKRFLLFCPNPFYIAVKLVRQVAQVLSSFSGTAQKMSLRVTLLRQLLGSGWGADSKALRTASLSVVYSTAEYCAPVWYRSAHTHLIFTS